MTLRSRVALGIQLAISIVLVVFGIGDVLQGPDADPAITMGMVGRTVDEVRASEPTGFRLYDFVTRGNGLNLVVMGALFMSILSVPYRSGDRWAWATMWLLPAWALATPVFVIWFGPAPGTMLPPPAISGPIVAVVAGLALLVDRRRFTARVPDRRPIEVGSASAS